MAAPAPASLRDLYITPSNSWSFVPPSLAQDTSNTSSIPPASGPSTLNTWSTRTSAPNPLFELSSLTDDDSGLDITSLAKELLAAALLQYATSAIAQPWEVGKTLLQVQWVPRDPTDLAPEAAVEVVEEEEEVRQSLRAFAALISCREHLPHPFSSATPRPSRMMTRTLLILLPKGLRDRLARPMKKATSSDIQSWTRARSPNM